VESQLRNWLAEGRFEPIVELASSKKRVLSELNALTYDPDPLISWRAVEASGIAAGRIASRDPEHVRGHIRRLLWLLSDESGGIGWHAAETIGEIIRSRPDAFQDFAIALIALLNIEPEDAVRFRCGTLWAIGRVAQVAPEAVLPALSDVAACLKDPDPQVRGHAAWCLGQLGAGHIVAQHQELLSDESSVEFYRDSHLLVCTVADLAGESVGSGT